MTGYSGEREEGVKKDVYSTTGHGNMAKCNVCARRTHDLMRADRFLFSGETRVCEENCPRQTMRSSHLLVNESNLHFGT